MAAEETYTNCYLTNRYSEDLLLSPNNWIVPAGTDFPAVIPAGEERHFRQGADPNGRSVVGLEYVCHGRVKLKWVIAWSNSRNDTEKEYNKVYTQILLQNEDVDWDEIRRSLDRSGQRVSLSKVNFSSDIEVNSLLGTTPDVRAAVTASPP